MARVLAQRKTKKNAATPTQQKNSLQPQLTVNVPGDRYEQEADAVADHVMQMSDPSVSSVPKPLTQLPVSSIQRQCAECEKEKKVQLKESGQAQGGSLAPQSVYQALSNSRGQALDKTTRHFMEARFNRNFSDVRVHTDAQAAASAQDIQARAYTSGHQIVFAKDAYQPNTEGGKRLLAHELVHTLQQNGSQIKKQSADDEVVPLDRTEQIADLKTQIETTFLESIALKAQIEPTSSPENEEIINSLNQKREDLVRLLEERLDLINLSLSETTVCDDTAEALESDRVETAQWLFPLSRWKKRQEIEQINETMTAIDQELIGFDSCTDETDALHQQLDSLKKRRRSLAKDLTSTAIEMKQFDSRWGKQRYGNDEACTTVAESACGPTSLAMVLNFYELENPEGAVLSGSREIILPTETVAYAADHGRVCNEGTSSKPMMGGISKKWEDYRGRTLDIKDIQSELENGRLVIFSCHSCKGKNAKGEMKTYGKHYMVLNGVDEAGEIFNVLDSGRREENNIETIDWNNLKTKTAGFWAVDTTRR